MPAEPPSSQDSQESTPEENNELLTIDQAVERVGYTRQTLYRAMKNGELPYTERKVYKEITERVIRASDLAKYRQRVADDAGKPRGKGRPRNQPEGN